MPNKSEQHFFIQFSDYNKSTLISFKNFHFQLLTYKFKYYLCYYNDLVLWNVFQFLIC